MLTLLWHFRAYAHLVIDGRCSGSPGLGLVCALHRISTAISLALDRTHPPSRVALVLRELQETDTLSVDMMHFLELYGSVVFGLAF